MADADDSLRELYQQILLDHARRPRNQGRLEGPGCFHARGHNPACGDEVDVWLKMGPQGQVEDARFEGQGCAISQASASLMTVKIKGAGADAARRLMAGFHAIVTGEGELPDEDTLGDLLAFEGVRKFPQRVKCATLAWHAAEEAMQKGGQ